MIGGEAGDGVRAAGGVLGKILNRHGLYSFVRDDYQSLIRGGHNFSQVIADSEKVWTQYHDAEVLVALDERTLKKHEDRLSDGGQIIFDPDELDYDSEMSFPVPMSSMVEEVEGIEIMKNSVALGVVAYLYGLELDLVEDVLQDEYGEKADKNIELAKKGYAFAEEYDEKIRELQVQDRKKLPLLTGNQSISLGASKAGLDVYVAYPMTPSTSILHFIADYEDELGLTVMQAENEISVINMALGSSYVGARSMVASSGGGFALMQEAVSLAGMSETPILVVDSQRAAPSTGVPTYTSQADLNLALNSGHGEFPSIVLAPGDQEEAYYRAGEALNLAWKHQIPVILLSDKHLSESRMSSEIDFDRVSSEEGKVIDNPGEEYKRYEFTEDGVSPLAFPGMNDALVQNSSYEHDESGFTTEEPEEIEDMQNKRKRKWEGIEEDVFDMDPVKVYGDEDADNVVLAWGSTKGALLEALKHLDMPIKFVQPIYLKPFPREKVLNLVERSEKLVCVEGNSTGQLSSLIRKELLLSVDDEILKYDSRPFNPLDLAEELKEVFS